MRRVVKVLPEGLDLRAAPGELLSDVMERAGIPLSLYCGRRGLCGKCRVEIVRGAIPEADEFERSLMARGSLPKNHRLACRFHVDSDVSVRVPPESRILQMPVLSRGTGRSVGLAPAIKKIRFSLSRPGLVSADSVLDSIHLQFPGIALRGPSLETLRRLSRHALMESGPARDMTAVIHADAELLDIEPGDTTARNFGLAIDLGTTTVVVELLDLNSGTSLGSVTGLNAQAQFGTDVVSRITAAYMDAGKLKELRASVVAGLNAMIGVLIAENQVSSDAVYETVLAGNTAMNHLFLGLSVATLAVAPYHAVFSVLPALPSAETGLTVNPLGKVYLAPNIKSFVGGDIAAGLAAVGMDRQKGNFLFVDLGTNGEIVIKKGTRFTTTSTAAGPAFEGMAIGCGMLALPGAVYKAQYRKNLTIETIGGLPARGICGTGLIDLVAGGLDKGLVSSRGNILNPSRTIAVTKDISLIQKDIREIQLAVAAIKTGIRMLLGENRMTTGDLDGIYVAGAFGNYLSIDNAVKLGLLPRFNRRKIHFVGNTSVAGAKVLLLSLSERRRCEKMAQKIRHVSLAKGDEFQAAFVEALEFKAWS
jgi:uncharacterized 2Fe-2S/4Fe-4S cluster protein (DUF4445 family)